MIYVVMGVSGCGKSSIGQALADKLNVNFYDADDFHSKSSVEKMSNGIPLTDEDRLPWLTNLAEQMVSWNQQGGAVLACSALKQKYREWLSQPQPDQVTFVYLQGSFELISNRLAARKGHFMSAKLLTSQFETLEEPTDAIIVSIEPQPAEIVEQILQEIK
ncbi:gluconokinase [Catenovulum sp. 2E275]|uniref:gluconokinase n=1 Tax=Catenovulum sp. 2E275 TaxID=2980497 RepID=UPI0021CF8208|nr:gluconokinase [Catenovulum sp. 2E275]MCU4674187.1 gluconokinase [Catenovulum sp. 2E275]